MLWIKSFHVIFMVTWFAGLFYLPRLFVYHAMSQDEVSNARFKIMERKLFYGIMTPGAIITLILGLWLFFGYGWFAALLNRAPQTGWLHAKLFFVLILVLYHVYCWKFLQDFKYDRNYHSHVFYRWFNEFPVLVLVAVTILVIVKPF
ncbi:protoporphyrinogen oxidase HemJ [Beggiatoa leptomitoformis]|uniref:Protoporphyrinogen IX oxidase n=1 Tax=Beggiatoa leptomitoformis TaxID=288004 RepID=A0A2N9YE17_9GAMM|nr:protoporphyrinogen oxidase HemJ [Beggiatoa leptomitoformis]ALG68894.1 protoporphyrinogen oxidase HemJ [Beggiatoa leptomitoformis]AUI68732.1 protoporphyrinogen oxidase HemJ [Beggiatoa leptomitoformis]